MLPAFIEDVRASLGAGVVGVFIYGSAVRGGFDPALSDLDLVVVTEPEVDAIDFDVVAGIIDRLAARHPDWADRLDIVFVGRRTLADFRSGGPFLEISHELPLRLIERAEDWLETWFLVRDADRPIIGLPAASLIPPIDTEEFLSTAAAGIPEFVAAVRDDWPDGKVAYRILTVCRILRSIDSGELCTKQEGAEWVAARFPAMAPLIRAAWEVRSTDGRRAFTRDERRQVPRALAFLAGQVRS